MRRLIIAPASGARWFTHLASPRRLDAPHPAGSRGPAYPL